jgi:hypothetical protein
MKGGAQGQADSRPVKSFLTRNSGRSRADDHEMLMASLLILAIWLFE